jgi:hypothetical protein
MPTSADPKRNDIRNGRTAASTQLASRVIAIHGKCANTNTAAMNGSALRKRYRIATEIGTATIAANSSPITMPWIGV